MLRAYAARLLRRWEIRDGSRAVELLHVDDSIAEAVLLREALAVHGWSVPCTHATGHAHAAALLNEARAAGRTWPDVAIVDLHLASTDGRCLVDMVVEREAVRGLRVVVLSGSLTRADRTHCRALGVPCYEKPMTIVGYGPIIEEIRGLVC